MFLANKLMRQLGKRNPQVQSVSFRIGLLAFRSSRIIRLSQKLWRRTLAQEDVGAVLFEFAVAIAKKYERCGFADGAARNFLDQVLRAGNGLTIEFNNNVVRLH